ncbi:CBS domain-containing protein [Actinoplanes sp. N902-109]|uniref:CBS domain-containing protein n=1 Tax=Actinoplanes sp. (strain N902-109) TaxID=649831 RepID=UPI0005A2B93F|nr:CBS domain-containing protein [Actinoplanes sp. N902-109]
MRTWTVDDVMTKAVVSVPQTASYREVVDLLIERHFSAVPVVDDFQRVTGVVSEADLLRKIEYAGAEQPRLFEGRRRRGQRAKALAGTAADLMSSPAVSAPAGTPVAAAARLMDDEDVKRLPVIDDLGRLVGIVTRGDLLKVHLRPDEDLEADIRTGVLVLLGDEAGSVSAAVDGGVVTLTGRVDRWSSADLAARLIRQIPGVVQVVDEVTFAFDDRQILTSGMGFGVA